MVGHPDLHLSWLGRAAPVRKSANCCLSEQLWGFRVYTRLLSRLLCVVSCSQLPQFSRSVSRSPSFCEVVCVFVCVCGIPGDRSLWNWLLGLFLAPTQASISMGKAI